MISMLREDTLDMPSMIHSETKRTPYIVATFYSTLSKYFMIDIPLQLMWVILFTVFTYGVNPLCSTFHSYGGLVIGLSVCVIFLEGTYYIMKKRVEDRMMQDDDINLEIWTQSFLIFFILIIYSVLWISGIVNLDAYRSETDHGCSKIFCLIIFYIIGLSIEFLRAFLLIFAFLNRKNN